MRDRPGEGTRWIIGRFPRWWLGVIAAVVVGASASSVLVARDRNRPETPAAFEVAPPATPRVAAFRVVYRVEDTAGSEPRLSTDVLEVRHPTHALLEHRDGPPPGGAVLNSTVQTDRFSVHSSSDAKSLATQRVPSLLTLGPSPEALEAAATAGLIERVGDAQVAGEKCIRWMYRSVDDPLTQPDGESRVEACVTPDGIPLRTAITLGGRQVRVAEAVEADRNPPPVPRQSSPQPEPGTDGGPTLLDSEQIVEGTTPDGGRLVAVTPPVGFRFTREITVTRRSSETAAPIVLRVAAWEQGPELVVVEQVLTPGNPPWPKEEGIPVDVGNGRNVRMVYRLHGAEVRLSLAGRSVRVASARPAIALAVARNLRTEK